MSSASWRASPAKEDLMEEIVDVAELAARVSRPVAYAPSVGHKGLEGNRST